MCARLCPDVVRQLPGTRRSRHLTTIENNAVHQLHLCERCAAERGVETTVADASIRSASFCISCISRPRSGGTSTDGVAALLQYDDGRFSRDGPVGLRALLHELRGGHPRAVAARARESSARRADYRPPVSETLERGRCSAN